MPIQKNVLMQDIQTRHVFIVNLLKDLVFLINKVVSSRNSAENLICYVTIYVQAMKQLNVKNLRNRHMSAMVVQKRRIVL